MTMKAMARVVVVLFALTVSIAPFAQTTGKAVAVVLQNPPGSYTAGQPIFLRLVTSNVSDMAVSVTLSPGLQDETYNCAALVKGPESPAGDEYVEPSERPSKRHTRSAFGYTLESK